MIITKELSKLHDDVTRFFIDKTFDCVKDATEGFDEVEAQKFMQVAIESSIASIVSSIAATLMESTDPVEVREASVEILESTTDTIRKLSRYKMEGVPQ